MLHNWLNITKLCDKCIIRSRGHDSKVIDSVSSRNQHLPNADLKSQAPVFNKRTWDMSNPLSQCGQQLLQPSSHAVLLWNYSCIPSVLPCDFRVQLCSLTNSILGS